MKFCPRRTLPWTKEKGYNSSLFRVSETIYPFVQWEELFRGKPERIIFFFVSFHYFLPNDFGHFTS